MKFPTSLIPPHLATASMEPVIETPWDARRVARLLFWQGWSQTQICEELKLSPSTVGSWKARDKWDEAASVDRCEQVLECRYIQLILKDKKTGGDFKEIDLIGRQIERNDRRKAFAKSGKASDLNPKLAARNDESAIAKRKQKSNLITHDHAEQLIAAFELWMKPYQEEWWVERDQDCRFIVKSRQIGATNYFAYEALCRGLGTGNNQIFISGSKNQAFIFRTYIIDFVRRTIGVELKGESLEIHRCDADGEPLDPVTFYFLATNYKTAQGYHGDVYLDEVFWVHGFEQLEGVASAIASHARYHTTLFSTPSSINHEAYAKWSGAEYNEGRAKADQALFDISHKALKVGRLGADGIWRQIVTLEDAAAKGCDFFDIDKLKKRYSLERFNNLFLCHFVDDSQSSFPMSLVAKCMVDSYRSWPRDYDPYGAPMRPFGERPVWLGYDPNAEGKDDAALVIVAPPDKAGGRFRILDRRRLNDLGFEAQAAVIEGYCARFNVSHMAIDQSGIGSAVLQLVQKFYPTAIGLRYDVELKARMVMKAQSVMRAGRLQWDAVHKDIGQCFLAIRPKITASGRHVTYQSSRAGGVGHADLAWAVMHVLINEPLDAKSIAQGQQSKVRIY